MLDERKAMTFSARLRRPVAFYITLLVLVSIIPLLIFAAVVLYRGLDAQNRIVASLLKTSTVSVNRVVEQNVSNMLTTLKVLSTAEALRDGDYAAFHSQAVRALEGTGSNLLLIDGNANQLLNTRRPYGEQLGPASDPESIKAALETQGPLVSDIFFGRTGQTWVFNVYQRVRLVSGEEALLTLTQEAQNMAGAVTRDGLSPGWNAALIDKKGNVIVSSDSSEATGKPFFMEIVPALRVGVGEASHDGIEYRVVTDFSPVSGWKIVAWAKKSEVDAPAFFSFVWLVAGGLIMIAAAAIGAIVIARLISKGVTLLARDAERVGAGERIAPRAHMIEEVEAVSQALADAASAREKAESEIHFLMREVAHRSKNQLTVIQAMLNQSASTGDSGIDFAEAFRKRVAGLARSTDLMIANAAQGVDLRELATNQMQPFLPDDADRFMLSGPPFRLDAQSSQTLGMALHELATNASKYGAFSQASGKVTLNWRIRGTQLYLNWRETGVELPPNADGGGRKGFGSVVLERMLGMALGAELERLMHEDGIEWRFVVPLDRLNNSFKDRMG